MHKDRAIRHIRKRKSEAKPAEATGSVPENRPEPSERELTTAVSRWVRDHRQRSEEFRRTFADLFRNGGFSLPTPARNPER